MTTTTREVLLEAQGTQPNFRYDVIQPLLQGRVAIEGATLRTTGATDVAGMWDNPKFKATPILILTTESSDQMKQAGRAAGATGWLVKPFDPAKLVEVIGKVIR